MKQGYTLIPDWMLEYDLDIYETLILAVIYGFSQDGESKFQGSIAFLMTKAMCSRRKVINALQSLVEKGLIIKFDKTINGVHLCDYMVSTMCTGSASHALGDSAPGAPQNKDIEINNTLSNNNTSRFVIPTIEEIRDYCQERHNSVDPTAFHNFYESKGWLVGKSKMKDWKAAVRTWETRQTPARSAARQSPGSFERESAFQHNIRIMRERYGDNIDDQ